GFPGREELNYLSLVRSRVDKLGLRSRASRHHKNLDWKLAYSITGRTIEEKNRRDTRELLDGHLQEAQGSHRANGYRPHGRTAHQDREHLRSY
ncbi:unnamed protein product, partial [Nesidiocoris tenuis]